MERWRAGSGPEGQTGAGLRENQKALASELPAQPLPHPIGQEVDQPLQ